MEPRRLRSLVAGAEERRFARANERLHIDQSPRSRTINELDKDLGAPLFLRNTRSMRLTHVGTSFREHVPRVFAMMALCREEDPEAWP
jgi:DNA-binding transcriptional LysR family regulator